MIQIKLFDSDGGSFLEVEEKANLWFKTHPEINIMAINLNDKGKLAILYAIDNIPGTV